jgi:membrane fusion protein, multidrug efflux system
MILLRVWIGRITAICAVGAAIWVASVAFDRMDREVRTHDALLFADNIGLAPDVSGRIVALRVKNNQRVAEGDILVEIDPVPFDLKLKRARAQVAALQAQVDLTTRQVAGQATGADAAATQIARARAQLGYAQGTVSRLTPLLDNGYVTLQQVDEARTNEKVAEAGVTSAIQQAEEARQKVGDTASLKAQLASAEADVGLAERDVHNTFLRAPFDGLVVGLSIAAGAYASEGRPLFTLIKTHDWYAIGNFRETQLPGIAIGDPAIVWLMSDNNRPIHGHVESLGWGVQANDSSGPMLSGGTSLPSVGRTLDWVVVAQRFPVRIRLDDPPEAAMRIGATVSIKVRHGSAR